MELSFYLPLHLLCLFLMIQLLKGCPECFPKFPDCVPNFNPDDLINTTILPDSAKEKGAVCLDGTPPAYNFAPGCGDGAQNWMVFLEGGAWCSTDEECYMKITKPRSPGCGSSSCKKASSFNGMLSGSNLTNPDFFNWNRVLVRYCDGSSFSGDIEATASYNGTLIYRRGARIFDAVIEALLPLGMENAANAILAGSSAGGLATTLHCDRFRNYLPLVRRVKCVSGDGYFIHGKNLPYPSIREKFYGDIATYHGIGKFLPISCTLLMDPRLCIFPENLIGQVDTPLFILNSAFDQFQIIYLLEPANTSGWLTCTYDTSRCNAAQIQTIKDFRTTFLQALPIFTPSIGVFIDSCYIHDEILINTPWEKFIVNNKIMATAVGDWYFDRSFVYEIDTVHGNPINCTKP